MYVLFIIISFYFIVFFVVYKKKEAFKILKTLGLNPGLFCFRVVNFKLKCGIFINIVIKYNRRG